jgi:aminopeptidase
MSVSSGMLERYADVTLSSGLAIQPSQELVVLAPLETAPLVRAIAERAYRMGSRLVTVLWEDEQLDLVRLRAAPRDSFREYPTWIPHGVAARLGRGDAYLQIAGRTPGLLAEQDAAAKSEMAGARWKSYQPVLTLQEDNSVNWCVISAATPGWASRLFPDLTTEDATRRLWDAIFDLCRLRAADPVAAWQGHLDHLSARCRYLNQRQFASLHYTAPGTDLSVGLPAGHVWLGGRSQTKSGAPFIANLPTEEVFTTPHAGQVDGTVVSSLPLNYVGTTIEGIALTFAGGEVTRASARVGEGVLRGLLETDPGSRRLGEVALVPQSSPVARSGIIFQTTLLDENAASHLALGQAYKGCIQGGSPLSDEEFGALGGNASTVHVDFMIGSAAMSVDGVLPSGAVEPIMRQGEWAFAV